jgi:hypothetical protein
MADKTCKVCQQTLPLELFAKDRHRKDGLRNCCRACWAARTRKWRAQKPEHYSEYVKQYGKDYRARGNRGRKADFQASYDEKRSYLQEFKSAAGCLVCSESDHVCLSFHHLDPAEKELQVSDVHLHSLEALQEEVKKCVVLCENCHRKHHAGRFELFLNK